MTLFRYTYDVPTNNHKPDEGESLKCAPWTSTCTADM